MVLGVQTQLCPCTPYIILAPIELLSKTDNPRTNASLRLLVGTMSVTRIDRREGGTRVLPPVASLSDETVTSEEKTT